MAYLRFARGFGRFVTVEPPRGLVDFNDFSEGRLIVALDDITGLVPGPGDPIVLVDDDGNSCVGRVEHVAEAYVLVRPIWETWVPAVRATWLEVAPCDLRRFPERTDASVRSTTQTAGESRFAELGAAK